MMLREGRRVGRTGAALLLAAALAVGGVLGGTTAAADDSALLDSYTPVTVSGESYGPITPNKPFTVSAPNAMVKGQPIVITGSGYLATDGETGSVVNFMVDAAASGDPNTLYTTRNIVNPVDGKVFGDKRSHGIVQAKADGTWRMEIPWPNETNTVASGGQAPRDAAFFAANWKAGTTHIVRILTGSLLNTPADYQRGISVHFTVVDNPVGPVATDPKIALTRATVEQGDHAWFTLTGQTPGSTVDAELIDGSGAAVAGTKATFEIGSGGKIVNKDGQTYERVTVPRGAAPGQYRVRVSSSGVTRVTSAAFAVTAATTRVYNPGDHAGGTEDLTVQQGGLWTFRATDFAKNGTLRATAVVGGKTVTLSGDRQISASDLGWKLDANGDAGLTTPAEAKYTRVKMPAEVGAGSYVDTPLEITFSDGAKTVKRTVTVEPALSASVTVAASAEIGKAIRVTGKGFVHPTDTFQGSRIGVKIDDGAYSRLDGNKVHSNKTIWYIIDAKKDGTFSVDLPLPDGTTSGSLGSSPAFATGPHTLRFLTGSLLAGDTSRTLQSAEFTVHRLFTGVPVPVVSGTAEVGKTLTATPGTWQPAAERYTYQWLRDGKTINTATAATYKVTAADVGKRLSVTVTGTKTGYTSVSKTSTSVTVAKLTGATPTITGTKTVGKTLTAKPGTWKPAPVTLKYQWLRDGKTIKGATKSSYKLVKADAGKKISVKVTGTRTGYTSVSKTSAKVTVAKVKATVKVTSLKAVKKGTQATLKVTIGTAIAKPTGTVKVTVNGKTVNAKVKASAKGKVSIKLPKISKKGSYKVKVKFTPNSTTAKSTSASSTVTKTLKVT